MKRLRIIRIVLLIALSVNVMGCDSNGQNIKEKIDQANYVRVDLPGSTLYVNLQSQQLYGEGTGVSKNTVYAYKKNF